MSDDRKGFEEAVANMSMASSSFYKEYVFYLHVLAQCKVTLDKTMSAPAGVNFTNDHYNLYLNPLTFNEMPLEHRIGVLKHEMLHIALGHILRGKSSNKDNDTYVDQQTNHLKFNYAADCALNQQINRKHLPEGAIYPDNYPNPKADESWGQTAEFYYNLLNDEDYQKQQEKDHQDDKDDKNSSEGKLIDDHSLWQESQGDEYVQQEITKRMVEKAANETTKGRGDLPSEYAQMIENLTITREVDWKKVLRKIVGNKKANTKKTLMRRDRRLPFANWIKGKTKDRVFDLAVISDVSGSVSDTALQALWGEILSICDTYKTPVTMVQVDTQPSKPEQLTRNSKIIKRKASGGTYLSPALDMLKENNVAYNAIVVTTDGFLCESDVEPFANLPVPVIWLIEKQGSIMSSMNNGKMVAVQLKE